MLRLLHVINIIFYSSSSAIAACDITLQSRVSLPIRKSNLFSLSGMRYCVVVQIRLASPHYPHRRALVYNKRGFIGFRVSICVSQRVLTLFTRNFILFAEDSLLYTFNLVDIVSFLAISIHFQAHISKLFR